MVEIECTKWKKITVQRTGERVELYLVSREGPSGNRWNELSPAAARCVAYMLLAATEHHVSGRASEQTPLVTRTPDTNEVELILWERAPGTKPGSAMLSLSTARRLAHGLMTESQ